MAAFTNMHAVCWIQIFRSYFHTHLKPWVDSFSPFVIHNKEGATFVHGALKNASQDTHTHSFPSPCSPSPPNSPSLSLPSIWISCHLDTLRVNMDACMCAKVTYFSSQHNIIKSWVHPPLLLVYCLALRFCWLCVCMCVYVCFGVRYWCVLERQVFFGVVMHVHKCVCVGPDPLEFSLWWEWMAEPRLNICLWEWRGPTSSQRTPWEKRLLLPEYQSHSAAPRSAVSYWSLIQLLNAGLHYW